LLIPLSSYIMYYRKEVCSFLIMMNRKFFYEIFQKLFHKQNFAIDVTVNPVGKEERYETWNRWVAQRRKKHFI
jgi:hypothetical protein